MFHIDLNDPRPLYQQVVDGLKSNIAEGNLAPGDMLPSVRELAQSLSINPNTIARAYRDLQQTGVIFIRQGKGAWVAEPIHTPTPEKLNIIRVQLRRLIADAYHLGLSGEQVLQILQTENCRCVGIAKR